MALGRVMILVVTSGLSVSCTNSRLQLLVLPGVVQSPSGSWYLWHSSIIPELSPCLGNFCFVTLLCRESCFSLLTGVREPSIPLKYLLICEVASQCMRDLEERLGETSYQGLS